jgi:hypothetical protein
MMPCRIDPDFSPLRLSFRRRGQQLRVPLRELDRIMICAESALLNVLDRDRGPADGAVSTAEGEADQREVSRHAHVIHKIAEGGLECLASLAAHLSGLGGMPVRVATPLVASRFNSSTTEGNARRFLITRPPPRSIVTGWDSDLESESKLSAIPSLAK